MTIEEKYYEALERASKLRVQNPFYTVSQMMEHVFPELKESKNERIRKEIIDYIKIGTYKKDWIDWLENQDEKKLKWCVEDKAIIEDIIGYFQSERNLTTDEEYITELDKYCELLQRIKEYFE